MPLTASKLPKMDQRGEEARATSRGVVRAVLGRPAIILAFLLGAFFVILGFVPLRQAVQIGADEGFELAKTTLCLKGYRLYTDVWCDHPPVHTFLLTQVVKHISPSVAGPRWVTVGFAVLLLVSVFCIALRVGSALATPQVARSLRARPSS